MKSVKQRVLELLIEAWKDKFFYDGRVIPCPDGWVPQWALCSISIVGSTEGKRRFRELRADPNLQKRNIFETKKEGHNWYYRIRPRQAIRQSRLAFMEATAA